MKTTSQFLVLFALFLSFSLAAQNAYKMEREKRISESEFPSRALEMVSPLLTKSSKLHFYQEMSGNSLSYEVKLKYDHAYYSIEFDSLGTLLDVELLYDWHSLSTDIKTPIQQYLDQQWYKSRVTRLQQQFYYFGKLPAEITVLPPASAPGIGVAWELEVEAQADRKSEVQSFELRFDSDGKLREQRPIVRNSNDHLLY